MVGFEISCLCGPRHQLRCANAVQPENGDRIRTIAFRIRGNDLEVHPATETDDRVVRSPMRMATSDDGPPAQQAFDVAHPSRQIRRRHNEMINALRHLSAVRLQRERAASLLLNRDSEYAGERDCQCPRWRNA